MNERTTICASHHRKRAVLPSSLLATTPSNLRCAHSPPGGGDERFPSGPHSSNRNDIYDGVCLFPYPRLGILSLFGRRDICDVQCAARTARFARIHERVANVVSMYVLQLYGYC